ncbi:rod shape-determining protein RodA [Acidaminobacter sp. JC074]|uniref:rod shape-determining protein RodA n=1 Tax=Acidaminobacter sp. JC074 TaxID=2530199 RepID=UPI001F0EEAB0|nr:rod shape-determining protein RodA [Acidaminobacter sp. JC074]MCH4886659.1 rod shape-determining protein RodA [Acidaminobacter sp. JC074]
MENRSLFRNIDFGLILLILLLVGVGMLAIASATRVMEDGISREVKVQAFAFFIGAVIVIVSLMLDYNAVGSIHWVVYGLSIVMLLLVYVPGLGAPRGGALSWIDLGVMDLQTSEVAKIGFIISFAKFLENHEEDLNHPKTLLKIGAFVAPFLFLIYKQPDFGTMLVFVSIIGGMLLVAKWDWRYIGTALGLGIIGGMNAGRFLDEYQMNRLFAFLEPENLLLPGNYHVNASKTTIGAGMMTGRGLFEGIYHKGDWLPVQETDFIFAVWCEETGFVGGAIIIGLLLLLLMNLMKIAYQAKDKFGTYIVTGIVFMFLFQIFENIGMTMGLMPVTGITLPFISYGGSSMITNTIMIGIALNVHMRRKKQGMFSNR